MKLFEFVGLNVITVGAVVLVVLVYMVFLINKRRKSKFLHTRQGEDR